MSEGNLELVRQQFASEAVDEAEVQRLYEEFWHPDIDYRAIEGAPDDVGVMRGRDAIRAYYADWLGMFDDLRLELADVDDAGDQIVATLRFSGRAKQSGVDTELRVAIVYTIRDGKCIRGREYMTREEASKPWGCGSRALNRLLHGRGWFRTSDLSRVKRALSH
jgi:ketosteroid isomerase-like protein